MTEPEEKYTSIPVSPILANFSTQDSDVVLTFRSSKSGRTALYLDAHMRLKLSQIEQNPKRLEISWTTCSPHNHDTNSKQTATSHRSTVIYLDNPQTDNLNHKLGTCFMSNDHMFYDQKILIKLEKYCLTVDGEFGYYAKVIHPKQISDIKVIDKDLDNHFNHLSAGLSALRIAGINL